MKRPRFRTRLFVILILFAVCPAVVLTVSWGVTVTRALPVLSATGAWERVAASGERAIAVARRDGVAPGTAVALTQHEQELRTSLELARRYGYLASRTVRVVAVVALVGLVLVTVLASRVAGHLSRQLSRPLDELVEWTERIAGGQALPEQGSRRGAPEFAVLRQRMRRLARELEVGRARALEAERAAAFRETARQVAHELKNPLTPIRFAVERLRRDVPAELAETVEVLAVESRRLEVMARSFAQFGRLPDGPPADVDLGELVRYAAKATVPEEVPLAVEVEDGLPMVRGHHEALARALSNVLINAVEACPAGGGGAVAVRVGRARADGRDALEIAVRDTGCGIAPEQLARIWEPYVTTKSGGTGLGLAIARQTVAAHGGTVHAVSAVGKGTEIRFLLPVTPANGSGEPGAVAAGQTFRGLQT